MSETTEEIYFKGRKPLFMPGVEEYAEANTSTPPDLVLELERDTKALSSRIMLSDRPVGRLLKILTSVLQPKLAIDIGTYTGHSALSIAEGLPEDGKVVTCEIDPQQAERARSYFTKSPFGARIDLRVGPALDIIRTIGRPIDLAFIDGDKAEYCDYYDAILDRLAPRGLIIVDNTLMLGGVLIDQEEATKLHPVFRKVRKSISEFNRHVLRDPRTENCLLTVSDGLTLISKR